MFLDAWFPIGVLFFCALCLLTYGAVSLVELSSSDIFKFVAAIFIGAGAGMALFSLAHAVHLWLHPPLPLPPPRRQRLRQSLSIEEAIELGLLVLNPTTGILGQGPNGENVHVELANDGRLRCVPGEDGSAEDKGIGFWSCDLGYAVELEHSVPCLACHDEGVETWVCRECGRGCPKGHINPSSPVESSAAAPEDAILMGPPPEPRPWRAAVSDATAAGREVRRVDLAAPLSATEGTERPSEEAGAGTASTVPSDRPRRSDAASSATAADAEQPLLASPCATCGFLSSDPEARARVFSRFLREPAGDGTGRHGSSVRLSFHSAWSALRDSISRRTSLAGAGRERTSRTGRGSTDGAGTVARALGRASSGPVWVDLEGGPLRAVMRASGVEESEATRAPSRSVRESGAASVCSAVVPVEAGVGMERRKRWLALRGSRRAPRVSESGRVGGWARGRAGRPSLAGLSAGQVDLEMGLVGDGGPREKADTPREGGKRALEERTETEAYRGCPAL